MPYHEKEEHKKTCPGMAGSVGIIRPVVKMGPCGGVGGDAWEMDVCHVNRIVMLVVWHDIMVDAMMVSYELDSAEEQRLQLGSPRDANRSEVYHHTFFCPLERHLHS
jgi:hypothetical protein